MKSLLLISHGSHSPQTKEEVLVLLDAIKAKTSFDHYHYAFLDVESPTIPQGIDDCSRQGAKQVVVLLNFLNSGKHVDIDIPQIIKQAQEKYPEVRFQVSGPIGQHEKIPELFLAMIEKMNINE